MHQLHDKTRKCDGKHMEIAGRGGAAEHIYILIYIFFFGMIYLGLTPDSRPGAHVRVKDHKEIIKKK